MLLIKIFHSDISYILHYLISFPAVNNSVVKPGIGFFVALSFAVSARDGAVKGLAYAVLLHVYAPAVPLFFPIRWWCSFHNLILLKNAVDCKAVPQKTAIGAAWLLWKDMLKYSWCGVYFIHNHLPCLVRQHQAGDFFILLEALPFSISTILWP
mgnify:CR=1 FL=1